MRKMYRKKRRSCSLCKPDKTGHAKRWTNRQRMELKEFDREARRWTGRRGR